MISSPNRTMQLLSLAAVTTLAALTSCISAAPGWALSSPTLDQEFVATDDANTRSSVGAYYLPEIVQTFTAGTTDALSRVDLQVYKIGVPLANALRATIYETDGQGKPTNLTHGLATATALGSSVTDERTWVVFTFSTPAHLTSGTRYALALTLDGNGDNEDENLRWAEEANTSHRYAGGAECVDGDPGQSDHTWYCGENLAMGFRTYMGAASTPVTGGSNQSAGEASLASTGSNQLVQNALGLGAITALAIGSAILWRRRARR